MMDLEGNNIDVSAKDCKSKHPESGTRCVLDAVHLDFGSEHMGRTEEGKLVFWKDGLEQD